MGMSKFKPNRDSQLYLLPPSIEDFIPQSHLARVVSEVVDTLDVSSVEEKYSEMGQKSYAPHLILKLLFYGYCIGIRSGRKIAAACQTDTAFMYLASMYRPDFRTINDFRKDNIDFMGKAFMQIVQLCRALGMGQVGTLIIDGTKLRANANPSKSKSKEEYQEWLTHIREDIQQIFRQADQTDAAEDKEYGDNQGDELPEQLRSKQQLKRKIEEAIRHIQNEEKVNLTDAEAKFIRSSKEFNLHYNCQTAITEDRVIVSAFTSNNASDRPQLFPAIDRAEENTAQSFENILADSGYASYHNYEHLEARNKTVFIPDQEKKTEAKKQAENPFHKSNFKYDESNDQFICPQGKTLHYAFDHEKIAHKQQSRVYIGKQCSDCAVLQQCCKGKARQIHVEKREHLRQKIRERLNSEEGKLIYLKRMKIEPVFGNIKHNLQYKQLHLRGIQKTTAEWQLICLAHNIKLIHQRKVA